MGAVPVKLCLTPGVEKYEDEEGEEENLYTHTARIYAERRKQLVLG